MRLTPNGTAAIIVALIVCFSLLLGLLMVIDFTHEALPGCN